MMKQFKEAEQFLRTKGIAAPETGIVLGTGLGGLVSEIDIEQEVNYDDIPHFPVSTVESHSGKLIYGNLAGQKVLAMQGRFHYYEGYTMQQVTFPIRVMKLLGIKQLLLSNACGAINLDFKKGELMVIEDHINLLPTNPLIGANLDEFGPRFPDMSEAYSKEMNSTLMQIANEKGITLHKGVYVAVSGPNLETGAEYRYLRTIGADVVGMSTVPEVIVAHHMGLPCAAISVLTDECDPDNLAPVNIEEIIAVAGKAEKKLIELFINFIERH
jgi:purine-nucleoside phosphorylase